MIAARMHLSLAGEAAALRREPPGIRAAAVLAAAQAGSADSQTLYGQMLLGDPAVERDERAAVFWFWQAAKQGQPMAMNMLGRCYHAGHGVAADPARASQWYRVAADKGSDWAMYNLGVLKSLGDGIPRDLPGALELFARIVERGINAVAINYIAAFHEEGWVYPHDMAEAARLYALAARQRHPRSMFNHARMLLDADRRSEALMWLKRALDAGEAPFRALVEAWLTERSLPIPS